MQLFGGINPYESTRFGFGLIDTIQKQRSVSASFGGLPVSNQREQMDDTTRHVLRMRKAMEAVRQLMPASESAQIEVEVTASATSAASLDLSSSGTATPTTLESTEEVNASTTGYSTDPPEWTGASTAQPTIDGEYDGSSGTDTLTFKVKKGGTAGTDLIQIEVFDSNNNRIDSLNFRKQDGVNTPQTLSNGLTVTFSEGDFVKNDSFTLEVYDSVENTVDPSNPFNGTGAEDPNLQAGLDVTAGSFEINGTTIDVAADDSINSVLAKINDSAAGVTATFDAATETVLLTQDTPGSTEDIVLANDTSGFVAAVKLDSAVAVPGQDGTTTEDPATPLAQVDAFSTVQNGSISVNGVSIDIDVDTDSLNDVLDRISASAADVTASYDSGTKKVTLTANDAESQLIVDSGTTNFFPAVEITDGTYEPVNETIEVQTGGADSVESSDLTLEYAETHGTELAAAAAGTDQEIEETPVSPTDAKMLGELVNIIADSMNALFDGSEITASPGTGTEALQNNVRSAVASWFDSEGSQFSTNIAIDSDSDSEESEFNTDFGIGFDFEKTAEKVFNFSNDDRSRFEDALASPQSAAAVQKALFGIESGGLFNQLHSALTAAGTDFEVDPSGLFLDVTV
ncbi:MAG: flagellin hook IN motif-containing protein [Desulfobacterales bacterium]